MVGVLRMCAGMATRTLGKTAQPTPQRQTWRIQVRCPVCGLLLILRSAVFLLDACMGILVDRIDSQSFSNSGAAHFLAEY
ncbi:hypothetical protein K438DRAFT_1829231 [Mycena galopus ATCC 62051]|nr:hypothetical protein K438DRAFT_1829231 [Mycena galopus ATCC 62051]